MDLKQLRYFLRIAELGSFVRAAEVLGVAQPTLSRQIRALEVELKTSFFHRNGRGVILSDVGSRFIDQARGVIHAADVALQTLDAGDRLLRGRVVCGLTPSVGALMIPEYVRRFRRRLPDASLSVVNHLSSTLHDQVRASRLDFAIFNNSQPSSSVQVESLSREPLYLFGARQVGRAKSTVAFSDVVGLPLLLPSRLHAIRHPVDLEAARLGLRMDVQIEIDNVGSILALVADGVGYTIATRFPLFGRTDLATLAVQQIVGPRLYTHLDLVTPSHRMATPLQEAAIDLARSIYRELTDSASWPRRGRGQRD